MGRRGGQEGGAALMDPPAVVMSGKGSAPSIDSSALPGTERTPDRLAPATAPVAAGDFQLLRLDQLAESPHNPRKHFDQAALEELAASIRESGIWEAIVVRPHPSGHGVYEIASGHRRFRAAKLAGLERVPAMVRPLTDAQFHELLTVANLQRENVHPLEEADAYAEMMVLLGWDVPMVARKVSKSESHVYDRLKFRSLAPAVRELFFGNRITPAHAVELTRIDSAAQLRAIDPIAGGLWEGEAHRMSEEEYLALEEAEERDPYAGRKLRTVRELRSWIQEKVRFDAAAADPVLFPEVTRAVEEAVEAKLKVVSVTYDHHVHPDAKVDGERTYGPQSWKRADGTEDAPACEFSAKVLGVVVVGLDQGRSFPVCLAKDKCTVHWADEIKAKAKRAKDAEKAAQSGGAPKAAKPKEDPWDRQQRLQREAHARFVPVQGIVLQALAACIKKASVKPGSMIEQMVVDELQIDGAASKKALVPRGKTSDDLLRHYAFVEIQSRAESPFNFDRFKKMAKALGLDVDKAIKSHEALQAKASASKRKK